ncbi:hypothetical protein TSUD_96810 [Trifolium subterraneum]|nr:hypothetical protein TSUD_96810 [Trifolium subterraneum]
MKNKEASGVYHHSELNQDFDGGFTLFVLEEKAFVDIPPSIALQSLSPDQKILVLKAHVLPIYYPLSLLLATTNPQQVTLATNVIALGFTINISSVNGTISLRTSVVEAVITQTMLDEQPISIFGISKVLLPKEIFGKNPMVFHSPPPPPSHPVIYGKEDVSSEVVDTQMWLVVFLSLGLFQNTVNTKHINTLKVVNLLCLKHHHLLYDQKKEVNLLVSSPLRSRITLQLSSLLLSPLLLFHLKMYLLVTFLLFLLFTTSSFSIDIIKTLTHGHHDFNLIASMLQASGVYDHLELKQDLHCGFTLFVTVDKAFAGIPPSIDLQSLPPHQKIVVLKAHVLPICYPLSLFIATTNP